MIINKNTFQVMTMSTHPNDNWMGEDWVVVPAELETEAQGLSPFVTLEFDDDGALAAVMDDAESRAAWLAENPVPEDRIEE
jgi:hypothetical protein